MRHPHLGQATSPRDPFSKWSLAKDGKKLTADGDDGKGKLVGILFLDYRLSEPFELGASGEWESPGDGNLFLRCRDD